MIQRERFEEFQKAAYLGRVLGTLLGANPDDIKRAEEVLEFAIYQTAWDPEQIRQLLLNAREVAQAQREERLRDARLMDRVAGYSVVEEDEDLPFPVASAQRSKRAGLTDAWNRDDGE